MPTVAEEPPLPHPPVKSLPTGVERDAHRLKRELRDPRQRERPHRRYLHRLAVIISLQPSRVRVHHAPVGVQLLVRQVRTPIDGRGAPRDAHKVRVGALQDICIRDIIKVHAPLVVPQDVGKLALCTDLVRLCLQEHLFGVRMEFSSGDRALRTVGHGEVPESSEVAGVALVRHQVDLGVREVLVEVFFVPLHEDVEARVRALLEILLKSALLLYRELLFEFRADAVPG